MEVSYDSERALESIRGFVSPDIFNFCCGDVNSDLVNVNYDDLTDDPSMSCTLDALNACAETLLQAHLQLLEVQPA